MSTKTESYGIGYLHSEDLLSDGQYRIANVEIAVVYPPGTIKSADKKPIDEWTIGFKGTDKRLVVRKTNCTVIHCVNGNPPGNAWIGQKITLQVRIIESFGGTEPAIRVIPHDGCLIRKNVIKRLGKKAVWAPSPATETDKPKESK